MVGSIRDSYSLFHCILYAKIHKIHREHGWTYLACKRCGRCVKEVDDCQSSSSGKKVIIRVIDDTGSTSLFLFNDMVFKVSEEQCYNLIKQHGPNYDDYLPDELNILEMEVIEMVKAALRQLKVTDEILVVENEKSSIYRLTELIDDLCPSVHNHVKLFAREYNRIVYFTLFFNTAYKANHISSGLLRHSVVYKWFDAFKRHTERLVNELKTIAESIENTLQNIEEQAQHKNVNVVLEHSQSIYEQSLKIADSQLELGNRQINMNERLDEGMTMLNDPMNKLGEKMNNLRNEAVEKEKKDTRGSCGCGKQGVICTLRTERNPGLRFLSAVLSNGLLRARNEQEEDLAENCMFVRKLKYLVISWILLFVVFKEVLESEEHSIVKRIKE
uniref:Replication protein A 70 kDa DNA-binding subunit B n=1 Tax=Tanacetum cinerariifolium TaxID=118510 RepID=A0A6L2N764_TANCI|nr:replication protein A 70 kDa DNA-binding subunit B [Tanacetum cinerariifolium]